MPQKNRRLYGVKGIKAFLGLKINPQECFSALPDLSFSFAFRFRQISFFWQIRTAINTLQET